MLSGPSAIDQALATVFCIAALLVVYAYGGFPVLIWILSRAFGRHGTRPKSDKARACPTVSLLICAHNEQTVIGPRLENALGVDYPPEAYEIVVASDGSTDQTTSIVRGFAARGVGLLDFRVQRGKAAVLDDAMGHLTGDIVVLSDANTQFRRDAIGRLVGWFTDPAITAVCGRLLLIDQKGNGNADGLYWRYETFLKRCESRLGALLGANGAIYAIRRDRYVQVPAGTIVDDFVIPLLAVLGHGGAVIYDPRAIAVEETAPRLSVEFGRRARIGAGGFQSIPLLWRLLDPRRGWIALAFWSHKLLRWICPLLLIAIAVTSAALAWRGSDLFVWIVAAQALFYVASLLAVLPPLRSRAPAPLRLAAMFTGMNAALLLGLARWVSRRQGGIWQRTVRVPANYQPAR